MKNHIASFLVFLSLIVTWRAMPATAESSEISQLKAQLSELTRTVSELSKIVRAQQATLESLEATPRNTETGGASSVDTAQLPTQASSRAPQNKTPLANFNPEIGLVGDLVGSLTESDEDEEGNDRFSVREVELMIGHDIDPYSRFDSTIAFSDSEDPEIEEAFVSYWGLPYGIKGRFGRMRPKVGLTSPLHRDSLSTVDEPLVIQRYLGIEGLSRTGAEVSKLFEGFDGVTHEIIGGVLEGGVGEEGTLFGETRRVPTYYTRLRSSVDLADETFLDLGTTFLSGSADDDSAHEARAFGLDLAVDHRLDSVRRIRFESEAYLQDRSAAAPETSGHHEEEEEHARENVVNETRHRTNPWGMYTLLDYRFTERWSTGARWDYVEPVNIIDEARNHENAYSAYLTFHQSEFARWRFQYQYAESAEDSDDNRFFLQGTFAIGTHKHQLR